MAKGFLLFYTPNPTEATLSTAFSTPGRGSRSGSRPRVTSDASLHHLLHSRRLGWDHHVSRLPDFREPGGERECLKSQHSLVTIKNGVCVCVRARGGRVFQGCDPLNLFWVLVKPFPTPHTLRFRPPHRNGSMSPALSSRRGRRPFYPAFARTSTADPILSGGPKATLPRAK